MAGTTVRRLFASLIPILALLASPILAQGSRSTDAYRGSEPAVVEPLLAPESVVCPCAAGTAENEPTCGVPPDTTNGGCNSAPNIFSPIACGQTICGTTGSTTEFRDTDWFALVLDQPSTVRLRVTSEFSAFTGILDHADGETPTCPPGFSWLYTTDVCVEKDDTRELSAGTWWIFIAHSVFTDLPCGTPYTLTVECPIYEEDFEAYPPPWSSIAPKTCDGSCFPGGQSSEGCFCDANCSEFLDCCLDACATCGECPDDPPTDVSSCSGYCGSSPDRGGCYCDGLCIEFNDCCVDACALCGHCF